MFGEPVHLAHAAFAIHEQHHERCIIVNRGQFLSAILDRLLRLPALRDVQPHPAEEVQRSVGLLHGNPVPLQQSFPAIPRQHVILGDGRPSVLHEPFDPLGDHRAFRGRNTTAHVVGPDDLVRRVPEATEHRVVHHDDFAIGPDGDEEGGRGLDLHPAEVPFDSSDLCRALAFHRVPDRPAQPLRVDTSPDETILHAFSQGNHRRGLIFAIRQHDHGNGARLRVNADQSGERRCVEQREVDQHRVNSAGVQGLQSRCERGSRLHDKPGLGGLGQHLANPVGVRWTLLDQKDFDSFARHSDTSYPLCPRGNVTIFSRKSSSLAGVPVEDSRPPGYDVSNSA